MLNLGRPHSGEGQLRFSRGREKSRPLYDATRSGISSGRVAHSCVFDGGGVLSLSVPSSARGYHIPEASLRSVPERRYSSEQWSLSSTSTPARRTDTSRSLSLLDSGR